MAVSSTNRKAGPFIGNGSTITFPFAFKVFAREDLDVISIQSGSGSEETLVLNSDYAASLNLDQDNNPGGTITLLAGPLAVGYRLVITSDIPELQEVTLTNFGAFLPDVINGEFDRLTILIQQLQEQVDRCIKFPTTDVTSADLPPAEIRADKFLTFGADGGISLVDSQVAPVGSTFFGGNLNGLQNGTNKVFTLTNGGTPIGIQPVWAIVWCNFPRIFGVQNGYTWGPLPGQVTFDVAPDPNDTLGAQGVYTL